MSIAPKTSEPNVQVVELEASYADFALAAGLPHDASKGDVLAAMASAKASTSKLLEAVGAKTPEEAIGKIGAERETHADLVKAVVGPEAKSPTSSDALAKLAADRKSAERVTALGMVEKAKQQGKTAGEKAIKMFDDHGMAALVAHLDALVPNGPLVTEAPTQPAGSAGASPTGAKSESKPKVILSKADEKLIKAHGRDREEFIKIREQELADKAAIHADDEDADDGDDE